MFTSKQRQQNLIKFKSQIDIVNSLIKNEDFLTYEFDKKNIYNDDIFFIVKQYDTKECSENKLEDHIEMIDVHYALAGKERIVVGLKENLQLVTGYNQETDCAWYSAEIDQKIESVELEQGESIILFPGECHEPEIKVDNINNIKVIFKIKTN